MKNEFRISVMEKLAGVDDVKAAEAYLKNHPKWDYKNYADKIVSNMPVQTMRAMGSLKNPATWKYGWNQIKNNFWHLGDEADKTRYAMALRRRDHDVAMRSSHGYNGLGGFLRAGDELYNEFRSRKEKDNLSLPHRKQLNWNYKKVNDLVDNAKDAYHVYVDGDTKNLSFNAKQAILKGRGKALEAGQMAGWAAALGIPLVALITWMMRGRSAAPSYQQPRMAYSPMNRRYYNGEV